MKEKSIRTLTVVVLDVVAGESARLSPSRVRKFVHIDLSGAFAFTVRVLQEGLAGVVVPDTTPPTVKPVPRVGLVQRNVPPSGVAGMGALYSSDRRSAVPSASPLSTYRIKLACTTGQGGVKEQHGGMARHAPLMMLSWALPIWRPIDPSDNSARPHLG
ncbi:hypothetical protein B296_00040824 [Ensete ventricosum]|uniref:Uncharacterized protein n=1 Tax=Ensete ventricosum TaxID=4639 RepID=A0A426YT45_ENSVE|nr:hypothetical protein B296_00040824 [Ensete ventricosum]